ncbi:hypothetical protein [Clostridioides sp. ES-S-0001-02]|uniref:hypothetical protein n=1 Tax=Clostridioides sp. ES-S-0001-02 TaxID=2770770 RepID=UPI001D118D35|nr:hypothetical protein [Clostridioides sp. ES-S-0001-02]
MYEEKIAKAVKNLRVLESYKLDLVNDFVESCIKVQTIEGLESPKDFSELINKVLEN